MVNIIFSNRNHIYIRALFKEIDRKAKLNLKMLEKSGT